MKRNFSNFRKGDVIRADRGDGSGEHVWVIMSDVRNYTKCVRAFNFTSCNHAPAAVLIDVSKFGLPAHWFKVRKAATLVRIDNTDCLSENDVKGYLGNLNECCVELMDFICQHSYSCSLYDIDDLCECNFQRIRADIKQQIMVVPQCGCQQPVYQ